MKAIQIGTDLPKDKLNDIINSSNLSNHMDYHSFNNRDIYSFKIENKEYDDILTYNKMADLVQNIINELYMKSLIKKRTEYLLRGFLDDEFTEIEDIVYEVLLDDSLFKNEKTSLKLEIRDYLASNKSIIIDGYLRFRERSFVDLIDRIIEKVVMEIQMEEEYNDFVNMLRYYIDLQIPKVETINLVIRGKEFILMDERKNVIECRSIVEFEDDDVSKADIILSSLIILSPRNIVVHIKNDKEKELMDVLKSFFMNRVKFCHSCKICDD